MMVRKVLLVDDDPDIRKIAFISLTQVGKLDVLLASSGEEAIELASRQPPDVILLDVMMPGLDGPSTLERLRANPATRGLPVIFLTAKVQRSEIERYVSLGVIGVVSKPFDPITLHLEVARLLAGQK